MAVPQYLEVTIDRLHIAHFNHIIIKENLLEVPMKSFIARNTVKLRHKSVPLHLGVVGYSITRRTKVYVQL